LEFLVLLVEFGDDGLVLFGRADVLVLEFLEDLEAFFLQWVELLDCLGGFSGCG
jgi:hypothetical protein